ncbi:MAG: hypothetical protein ACI9JN_000839 [Bacteroidia bacterium]|jgi:hypothetical protein
MSIKKSFLCILLTTILTTYLSSCGCDGALCDVCPPTMPSTLIVEFDTSLNGYRKAEVDSTIVIQFYPNNLSDTFPLIKRNLFPSWNNIPLFVLFNGFEPTDVYEAHLLFQSGQRLRFENLELLDVTPPADEKNCCGPCPEFALSSIEIDSILFEPDELPIIIHK